MTYSTCLEHNVALNYEGSCLDDLAVVMTLDGLLQFISFGTGNAVHHIAILEDVESGHHVDAKLLSDVFRFFSVILVESIQSVSSRTSKSLCSIVVAYFASGYFLINFDMSTVN